MGTIHLILVLVLVLVLGMECHACGHVWHGLDHVHRLGRQHAFMCDVQARGACRVTMD
jgi:hypothetical protein